MTLEEALAVVLHYSYLHRNSRDERVYNAACDMIREKAKDVVGREPEPEPEPQNDSWFRPRHIG